MLVSLRHTNINWSGEPGVMCPTGAKIKEMKNYLKSVTLVLATVTFMTMCLPIVLFADSAPLPRVILDAEGFSDWIPTKKIIDAAEQKLSKRFRIEAENAQNLSSTPPSLENYGRQYIGRIVGGRNLVEVIGFCSMWGFSEKRLKKWPLLVVDGCTCMFKAEYDVDSRNIQNFNFHACA